MPEIADSMRILVEGFANRIDDHGSICGSGFGSRGVR